jgi:hypothetical protein
LKKFGCLEIFLSVIFEKSGLDPLIIGRQKRKAPAKYKPGGNT